MSAYSDTFERAERLFKHGQLVCFQPPIAAYSRECELARFVGQWGQVYRQWKDGHAQVSFGGGSKPIVCNTAYLEEAP